MVLSISSILLALLFLRHNLNNSRVESLCLLDHPKLKKLDMVMLRCQRGQVLRTADGRNSLQLFRFDEHRANSGEKS